MLLFSDAGPLFDPDSGIVKNADPDPRGKKTADPDPKHRIYHLYQSIQLMRIPTNFKSNQIT